LKDAYIEKPPEKLPEPVYKEPLREPAPGKYVTVPVSDDEEGEDEKAEPPPPEPAPKPKKEVIEEVKGAFHYEEASSEYEYFSETDEEGEEELDEPGKLSK